MHQPTSKVAFIRGGVELRPKRRRLLLLGTALGSTLMALSSQSFAASCTQPASPAPITVSGAATPISCTNTDPRTATVAGDNAIGITTTGNGNTVDITNSGSLTTDSSSWVAQPPNTGYSQSTGARGIYAGTNGVGADITIKNTGDINSYSDSIKASDAATNGTVLSSDTHITITNSGNLTAGPNAEGIFARASYGENNVVTIDNSGSIKTGYSTSLSGTSTGIAGNVGRDGGLVDITNSGAITTSGLSANGISAIASYYLGSHSSIIIDNKAGGTINTTHGAYGIFATAGSLAPPSGAPQNPNDYGTITITNAAKINSGYIGIGAFTYGKGGDITITNSAAITSGNGHGDGSDGIKAVANGSNSTLSITNSGAIDTSAGGTDSIGIEAINGPLSTGASNMNISVTNTGNIKAGKDSEGIFARSYGAGSVVTVDNSGNIQTSSSTSAKGDSTGIFADVTGDNSQVNVTNSGAITTSGKSAAGISAIANYYGVSNGTIIVPSNGGSVVVNNKAGGTITTTGSDALGIFAQAGSKKPQGQDANADNGGTVDVTNAAAINSGSHGIGAYTYGTDGTVTVTNSGKIFSTNGNGIYAKSNSDDSSVIITNSASLGSGNGTAAIAAYSSGANSGITIGITGASSVIRGNSGFGVIAEATGDASSVVITSGADIYGKLGGIKVNSTDGSTVNISAGGYVGAENDLAIESTAGTVEINNSGDIFGRVVLSGNGNVMNINDGGLFRAITDSNFGAAGGTLNNSGTINASGGSVSFLGLASFVNGSTGSGAGLTTMIDGVAGDKLTTSGNFTGQGNSLLGVDVNFATSSADTLTSGGNASGHTELVVNVVGGGAPNVFVPVVTVTGTTLASDFELAGPVQGGFFTYGLFLQGHTHGLESTGINSVPFELPGGMTGAQNVWQDTTDFWQDRMADLRTETSGSHNADIVVSTPTPRMGGLWARAAGDWSDQDGSVSYVDPISHTSETANLDRRQNTGAFLGGVDMGIEGVAGGDVIFGLMAGYVTSTLDFTATGDSWNYKGGTVGAYATYLNGGFYLDGLLKADFLNVDINDNHGNASTNATNIGVRLDTGYRFATGWGFIEPQASLQWVHTQMDSLSLFGGDVSFDNGSSGRARIGVRVGTDMQMNGMTVTPDLTLSVWNHFGSSNSVGIDFPGSAFSTSDSTGNGTFGEVGAGVSVASANNWSGVVRGSYRFGDGLSAGSLGAALRYSW